MMLILPQKIFENYPQGYEQKQSTKDFTHMCNFVLNFKDKAKILNDHFSKQCTLLINDCILPKLTYSTDKRIETVTMNDADILSLLHNLTPNKAAGPDGISGQMLLLCDETVVLPL